MYVERFVKIHPSCCCSGMRGSYYTLYNYYNCEEGMDSVRINSMSLCLIFSPILLKEMNTQKTINIIRFQNQQREEKQRLDEIHHLKKETQ